MLAFELSINGTRYYVAGHADAQMLVLTLWGDCTANDAHVTTSVAFPPTDGGAMATHSYERRMLALGDEMVVRIVDVPDPD